RWYVYHDAGWHVRTTTKSRDLRFVGTIRAVGGEFKMVEPFKLENTGAAVKDHWKLSDDKKTLELDFTTNGQLDGFDFTLSPKTQSLEFTLDANGKSNPDRIFIGGSASHPSSSTFVLPAHPRRKK
ncbi:MAG: hypothetical protein ACRDD1_06835, partial [Planctomycetia bacterium]